MSLRAFLLNHALKLTERPRLARGSPDELRRYLNGEDDGSSKEDGNRKKRKSG